MPERRRVGVFFGGRSSEREVSLLGGRYVYQMLDRNRYAPLAIYWDQRGRFWEVPEALVIRNTTKEIEDRLETKGATRVPCEALPERLDVAFLVTHGKYGDDGCLQGLLELLHLPYTGAGVLGAALAMDKIAQRQLLKRLPDLGLPEYLTVNRRQWEAASAAQLSEIIRFGLPVVVKPSREGSTFGVTAVRSQTDLASAIEHALAFDNDILVERYLAGREFSCIVLGNDEPQALLPTETEHQGEVFTYEEKYLPGGSNKITPMRVTAAVLQEIQRQAILVYVALGLKGYARIDGFVTEKERVVITDPNGAASTGLGPSSWTFHQAAAAGFSVPEFLHRLIELALEAHAVKRGPL